MLSCKKLTSFVLAGLMSATIGLGVSAHKPVVPQIWSSSKWDKEKNKDYLNKY